MRQWHPRLTRAASWAAEHSAGVAFLVAYALYLVFLFSIGEVEFHYDSGGYWANSQLFLTSGSFDLRAYTDPLRGYSFPLILLALRESAEAIGVRDVELFRIASALLFAWATAVGFPNVFRDLLGFRVTLLGRLAMVALVFVFWRGYALYPLTDFASMAMLAGALLLVSGWMQVVRDRPRRFVLRSAWRLGGAGLLIGTATNIRPSYQIAFGALGVWVLVAITRRWRAWVAGAAGLACYAAALALTLWPQVYINVRNDRPPNPFKSGFTVQEDLYKLQLARGLSIQRFESNVADPEWAVGGVGSVDPEGPKREKAFAACCREDLARQATYGEYFHNVWENPASMLRMYAMHTFAGIDLWHPTVYLGKVRPSIWFRFLNVSVLYAAAVASLFVLIAERGWRRSDRERAALLAIAVLPSLIAIPGQVETRFFLPVYLFAYGVACFVAIPRAWGARIWKPRLGFAIGAGYVGWMIIAFSLSERLVTRLQVLT